MNNVITEEIFSQCGSRMNAGKDLSASKDFRAKDRSTKLGDSMPACESIGWDVSESDNEIGTCLVETLDKSCFVLDI